ncbi:MAG: NADH-quinone oxidoreductase subunit NuoG [Ilumatobacteraceae bacterium]
MTDVKPTSADGQEEVDPGPPPNPNDVHITINGKPVVAQKGDLIIKAADDAGEYIPRFCYHNRMEPVGMCRMCICEVDSGRGPQLTPTCMATVAEGMKVETESPMSKSVQEGIIELLLANHPLDCPVCDKGGECPLQDQSFSHGPGESRYVEEKRHYEKPIPISDLVYLDRERCILCDRCTRFADEVAGDALIHFVQRGNNTQVNTFPDVPFSSYFSGNTVQICPVGALTAKPYRFKARPWDLSEIESTCSGCATGCRIVVQSTRDDVVRHLGVDSEPVNWGWLCDKGRFGYEATNSPDRVVEPHVRQGLGSAGEQSADRDAALVPTSWSVGLQAAAGLVRDALDAGGPASIAVLGGAHGTNEDAYAWARLAKEVIGTPNVYCQFGDGLPAAVLARPRATIAEATQASTIVLLGPDLKEELGVLYLRIRDAATRGKRRIVELAPKRSGLSSLAWRSVLYEPGTQVAAMSQLLADDEIGKQLASGPVVVIVGRANLAESLEHTMAALDVLCSRVDGVKVLPAMRRSNVVGALQVGMQPGEGGKYTNGVLQDAVAGRIELLVLLGADPLADHPDTELTRRAIANVPRILAVDTFLNRTSRLAHVVLPAAAAGEKRGTHTNIEGRVSQVNQKVTPRGTAHPDWMIAVELGLELGVDLGWDGVDEITDEIASAVPAYAGVTAAAVAAAPDGVLAGAPGLSPVATATTPAVPDRNAYDFRLVVSRKMFDASTAVQHASSVAPLARPATVHVHPLDLARIGAVPGTEVKVSSARGSVVLAVEADDDVLRGTAWVPFNQPGPAVGDLVDCTAPVTDVRIETL